MNKICSKCKIEKNIKEFHIDKQNKDGHKNICKKCRKSNKYYFTKKNKNVNIKMSIYRSIKKNKETKIFKWLKFSLQNLKNHLELNFIDNMSWENYGKIWCMKMIILPKYYRYYDTEELHRCWNINNFIPIFLKEKNKSIIDADYIRKNNLYNIIPDMVIKFKGELFENNHN